ncbi:hypothetical protein CDL12_28131 [Handroanthus impetiginosus]|uniref:Transposase Tnp1/En/Spm-like domain-containing protein n=1 Tax=Handroanthus impetiginosus TaxID=429701 RepID=A0A2G9G229_9LAMI|nr:hypothetical protein CDL12_28131 [Handroanthus impetiginosus]
MSWTKLVATGNINNLDLNQVVGRQCLGPSWCEVHIQVAVERGEKLLRPYSILKTIGDTHGATIAWPLNLV